MEPEQVVQLSFVKDVLFGALSIVVFSALGWQQWRITTLHLVSVPFVFFTILLEIWTDGVGRTVVISAGVLASLVSFLGDLVTTLTFTCVLRSCCSPTHSYPAFAPGLKACSGDESGVQNEVVSITALITTSISCVFSILRIGQLGSLGSGGVSWQALAFAAAMLHLYQLSWSYTTPLVLASILWLVAVAGYVSFLIVWILEKDVPKWSLLLLLGVEAVGFVGGALPSFPHELSVAFYITQSTSLLMAGWILRVRVRSVPKDDPKKNEDIAVPVKEPVIGARARTGNRQGLYI